MNRLERVIAWFSPSVALRREAARAGLEAYKNAGESRLSSVLRNSLDPNTPVQRGAVPLREKARTLEQDNDIARHALDILVDKTIGTGLVPEPMVLDREGQPAVAINDRLARLYEDWSDAPEVSHTHDEASAQRLAARTFFRDGEMFYQHVEGNVPNYRHGSRIPYSYEMLEPDLVPFDYAEAELGITQGIAINAWRQAVAYYVLRDYYSSETQFILPTRMGEYVKPVPAERMEHIALRDRIAQLRGVSKFASVIGRFGDIAEIEESERVAARVAAAMCAVIVKGNADLYVPGSDGKQRQLKWKPGMVFDDLLPGERVESMVSNRPNNQVIEFRDANVRAASGGVGVGYSTLANKFDGTYSSQRQELVEQDIVYSVISEYFIRRLEMPKYRRFVRMAIMAGLVPEWRSADPETLESVWYATPAMPWVDPQKEISATNDAIESGLTSRSRAQRERGLSPRQVLLERVLEQKAERELIGEPDPRDQVDGDDQDEDETAGRGSFRVVGGPRDA